MRPPAAWAVDTGDVSASSGSSGLSGSSPSDSGAWLAIGIAAKRLGVTTDAIRKRIVAGKTRAHKRGGRWFVWVVTDDPALILTEPDRPEIRPTLRVVGPDAAPEEPEEAERPERQTGETGTSVGDETGGTGRSEIAAAPRETELRLVNLVEKLQEENRNLAGQLGFLQAQLQQAQETIKLLQAPPADAQPEAPFVTVSSAAGAGISAPAAEEIDSLRADLKAAEQRVAKIEAAAEELEQEHGRRAIRRPWWRFWSNSE